MEGENSFWQLYLKARIYILYQTHVVIDHLKYTILNKVSGCLSTLPSRMPSRKIWKHKIKLLKQFYWIKSVTTQNLKGNQIKGKNLLIQMVILICLESKCVIRNIFKLHKEEHKLSLFHWFRNKKTPPKPKNLQRPKDLGVQNTDLPNK